MDKFDDELARARVEIVESLKNNDTKPEMPKNSIEKDSSVVESDVSINQVNRPGSFYLLCVLVVIIVGVGCYFLGSTSGKKDVIKNTTNILAENKIKFNKYDKDDDNVKQDYSQSKNCPPIYMGAITSVYESSYDREGDYAHNGMLTIDNNTASCWSEGVSGFGRGEQLIYNFNGLYNVKGIHIWTGHQKSVDLFYKNCRPSVIQIEGSNGFSRQYRLDDICQKQTIVFDKAIDVNSISIIIKDVYRGSQWEDTCIAEVNFF